jgi:hypothetical protein
VQLHLTACVESPVSFEYVDFIAKFYKHHVDLFQTDISQIYTAIEKLLSKNKIKEAERFMSNVIITHFKSITNIEELLHMLIRACSIVNIESRNDFCQNLISPIAYELTAKKYNKKLAGIFFDFILVILDLQAIKAPVCACRILNISDFYPWKQLDKQIIHLIQSCIAYDKIITDSSSNQIEHLDKILQLIHERTKTNPTIFHATHETALQAILKWSSIINNHTGKPYDGHVLIMGQEMTELVDRQQMTDDICIQLIDILQKRIDNNNEPNDLNQIDDHFLMVSLFINKNQLVNLFFLAYCKITIRIY